MSVDNAESSIRIEHEQSKLLSEETHWELHRHLGRGDRPFRQFSIVNPHAPDELRDRTYCINNPRLTNEETLASSYSIKGGMAHDLKGMTESLGIALCVYLKQRSAEIREVSDKYIETSATIPEIIDRRFDIH